MSLYGRGSIDIVNVMWNVLGMVIVVAIVFGFGGMLWKAVSAPEEFAGYYTECLNVGNGVYEYRVIASIHHGHDPTSFKTKDYIQFKKFWDSLPDEYKIHSIAKPIPMPPNLDFDEPVPDDKWE